jgi:hypothetical protein
MIPDNLIVDFATELTEFRRVVCELDMPSIDVEATLQQIFDTITIAEEFPERIAYIAMYMGAGEGLYEGLFENSEAEINDDTQQRITMAVVKLGREIKNKLDNYNAYRQGHFPYIFRNYINDRTIVLSQPTGSYVSGRT